MLYAINKILNQLKCFSLLFFGVTFFILFTLTGKTQKTDSTKVNVSELKKKAKAFEKKNQLYDAIYYYTQYIEKKPDDIKSAYALADLCFSTRDYATANRYYDSVIVKGARKLEEAYYYKGVVLLNLEDYKGAIETFEMFRKQYRGHKDPLNLRRQAYNLIKSAEWALTKKDSIADITLHNLGENVNGPHIEFSPFPVKEDELIFGALLKDTLEQTVDNRKLYVAQKVGDEWQNKGELQGPFNHPLLHTGNAAFSPDGKRVYFTRCGANWQNNVICEIYMSNLVEGIWQEPTKLPYPVNDETNTSTQPTIGKNSRNGNDILYFVSDREGTRGGLDIWYTEFNKRLDEYNEPRNLGRTINTAGNECCPFYDKSAGSLYFSSNGKIGFGGFDIYKTTGSRKRWSDAEGLPKPINSSYDDIYFATLNGTNGFFTSNRPGSQEMRNGSCCDDIFYFKYNKCITLPAVGKVLNITNKDIYDLLNTKYNQNLEYIEDNEALANIPVKLYVFDNKRMEEIMINQTVTDQNGNYNFILERNKDYIVVIENYGYFDKRIKIKTKEFNCDETIDLKETGINYLPEITVRFNIYYEHDKSRLTKDAKTTIDTTLLPLFDLYPNAMVEIGSHTDNTGSDNYNERLSQRRSESVVNYLIENGIEKERLVAKGYGERLPIALNQNEDGSDNPEGRQLNRRTEFRIIGTLNSFYDDENNE